MSANIKASLDGTQAIIGVGGVDQMTVSNAGVVTANSFVGAMNNSSVTATGSTTARTLANRFADVVNVKDFGAVGNGVADDTAAFSAACAAAPTTDCISNNFNIQFPQRANIYVPAGSYLLNSLINTSGKEVVWHCSHGAEFLPLPQTGLSRLNGRLVRDGIHFSSYHFGIKDPATTLSIKGNPLEWHDEGAYVNAFAFPYQLADVAPRDCCSLVVDNRNISPTSDVSSANYTATTFLPATPLSSDIVKKLRVGMVIDTKHTPNKFSGFITAWALDGTSITVSGWFATGDTSSGQVPSNGIGAYINQFTKIFANNSLVWLDADPSNTGKAKECAGFELDIHNNKGTPGGADVNYAWGFDCANAGSYPSTVAYLTRGQFNIGFHALGVAGSGPYIGEQTTGFRYDGNQNGFVFQNRTTGNGIPIIVNDATLGNTSALYPNGDMRCLNTARAWVNFNGNLTTPITPRNGFNVSSITKTGTGQYTINFIVPMLNTNYCTLGSFNDLGAGASTFSTTAWNLNSVSIALSIPGVGTYDHGVVNVAIFNNNY
jgi:hypothetical protein